jgi:uncharacterized protein (TIGR00730 family)
MAEARPLSICVYCGSRHGERAEYTEAARRLGHAIGAGGMRLVYGGGNVGLMGEVADAALAAGAPVLGVIPRALLEREVGHASLTELRVVETMHQRKQLMAEQADAFIALPGGIGTFEELFEVWTWRQLGYHDRPIGLLNALGYYDPLLSFLDRSMSAGFVSAEVRGLLQVDTEPESLLATVATLARRTAGADDYRAI